MFEVDEVVGGEGFAVDGVGAVFEDVGFDQAAFEDVAWKLL